MRARVTEGELGGARWLGVRGEREDAFRALGDAAASDVHAVLDALAEPLRSWPAPGTAVDAVRRATRDRYARELAELEALAAGADADVETALLVNLRGDLGSEDGTGCSDLGWRRRSAYIAHNEDGDTVVHGRFTFVTLAVDGDAPVFVAWYPGFVPANSYVVTGHGLTWGIDHLTVHRPLPAPGRHFVARALQRCGSLDEVTAYLTANPSAGGFAYTIGEFGSGRVAITEAAAGTSAVVYADPDERPLLWHTNHLRYTDETGVGSSENSEERGCVLDKLEPPLDEPDAGWFLDVLAGAPVPNGVHRPATPESRGMTLATAVAGLTERDVTVLPADGTAQTVPLDALLAGP